MEDSEGTVRQIGAFSEGIQNLTVRIWRFCGNTVLYDVSNYDNEGLIYIYSYIYQSMLKDDEFFKEISNSPNSSVTDEDSNAWDGQLSKSWKRCAEDFSPTWLPETLPHFFVLLKSKMSQNCLFFFFFFEWWCLSHYCHLMTEGTYQLVSGEHFYSFTFLVVFFLWASSSVIQQTDYI